MDKLKMAHEVALAMIKNGSSVSSSVVWDAWRYADEMQAEADERKEAEAQKGDDEVRQIIDSSNKLDIESIVFEIDQFFDKGLNSTELDANKLIQSIYEKLTGEVLTPSNSVDLEWQPDWSQLPEDAKWWAMDSNGKAHYFMVEPFLDEDNSEFNISIDNVSDFSNYYKESCNFGYKGDWRESLRKRP